MRPLFHPSIEDVRLDAVLYALSDPVRVAIFKEITGAECAQTCQAVSCVGERTISKSSLSQHFRLLREAGLIRSERHGVELRNTSRCAEIEGRFPGLILAILNAHAVQAAASARPDPRHLRFEVDRQRYHRGSVHPGQRIAPGQIVIGDCLKQQLRFHVGRTT